METLCRLCRCDDTSSTDIFSVDQRTGCVIATLIEDLLQIKVTDRVGLPRVICSNCNENINGFKNFKDICLKSNATFEQELASKEINRSSLTESLQYNGCDAPYLTNPVKVVNDELDLRNEADCELEDNGSNQRGLNNPIKHELELIDDFNDNSCKSEDDEFNIAALCDRLSEDIEDVDDLTNQRFEGIRESVGFSIIKQEVIEDVPDAPDQNTETDASLQSEEKYWYDDGNDLTTDGIPEKPESELDHSTSTLSKVNLNIGNLKKKLAGLLREGLLDEDNGQDSLNDVGDRLKIDPDQLDLWGKPLSKEELFKSGEQDDDTASRSSLMAEELLEDFDPLEDLRKDLRQSNYNKKHKALVLSRNFSTSQLALYMGVSSRTIWRWKRRYKQMGFDGLKRKQMRKGPRVNTPEQGQALIQYLRDNPFKRLEDAMAASKYPGCYRSASKVLRAEGLAYNAKGGWHYKKD